MKVFAVVLALTFLGACSGAPVEEGVFFPTWSPDGAVPTAIVQGTLAEDDGCLYLETNGKRTLVIWEGGMGFEGGALLDDSGETVARVGEVIHGGGGYFGRANVEDLSGESVPERYAPPGEEGPDGDDYAIIYEVAAGPFE